MKVLSDFPRSRTLESLKSFKIKVVLTKYAQHVGYFTFQRLLTTEPNVTLDLHHPNFVEFGGIKESYLSFNPYVCVCSTFGTNNKFNLVYF